MRGNVDIMKMLLKAGCSLNETGHVCFSRKHKNSVASNVIGAAAYCGQTAMLKWLMSRLSDLDINFEAREKRDDLKSTVAPGKTPALQREFANYTPLFLAAVGNRDRTLEPLKILLSNSANVRALDTLGNTVLHVAVRSGCAKAVEYLLKNDQLDAWLRNKDGDTALSLAQKYDNDEAKEMLQQKIAEFRAGSQRIIDSVLLEEERLNRKRNKKLHRENKEAREASPKKETKEKVEEEEKVEISAHPA